MSEETSRTSRREFIAGSAAVAAAGMSVLAAPAARADDGYVGKRAPEWDVTEWINADPGTLASLSGSVVVIDFFQLWCPGCNKFSGPLLTYWQKRFAEDIAGGRLTLMKIHTVFEGHNYQTVKRLRGYVDEKKITLPVGVDRHIEGQRLPETMRRYRTRGTPEMAVIDRAGVVQFQQFGYFEPEPIEAMIQTLMARTRA